MYLIIFLFWNAESYKVIFTKGHTEMHGSILPELDYISAPPQPDFAAADLFSAPWKYSNIH